MTPEQRKAWVELIEAINQFGEQFATEETLAFMKRPEIREITNHLRSFITLGGPDAYIAILSLMCTYAEVLVAQLVSEPN